MHRRHALFALLLVIPACSKEPTPPAPPTPPEAPAAAGPASHPQIAFIPGSAASADTAVLHAGAEKALAQFKKGPDGKPVIDLLWKSPVDLHLDNTGDQAPAQRIIAESLLKQGVAAIIIEPDNQASLNAVTTAAAPSRTPVIAINTTLQDPALKSTINFPADATDKDYNLLAFTAVKTAGDILREKKVEKQILIPSHSPTP